MNKMKVKSNTIIGAIAGDIIGSTYEWNNVKTTNFKLFTPVSTFTDDTVLTMAVADCLLHDFDFSETLWKYGREFYGLSYGPHFKTWLRDTSRRPYHSFGNGAVMRVSPIGFAYDNMQKVLKTAKLSAEITHSHPEGIKGAQAIAAAVFLANIGKTKQEIKYYIETNFYYDLNFTIEQIRSTYKFDVSCQGSVPQAIVAFLESTDYENALRLAISIGGDSDTLACMAGGIAAAYYKKIPANIIDFAASKLPQNFINLLNEFENTFCKE